MGFKLWLANKALQTIGIENTSVRDAGTSGVRNALSTAIKRIGLRFGDITSKDFEDPEYDLVMLRTAYDSDSYIRQGVDKYVDQIFKEGFDFFGKTPDVVNYVKLRLAFMAETTGTPTQQFLIDVAEDVVKYANCIIVKARQSDPNQIPPKVKVAGIDGAQPVVGYYCLNPSTIRGRRDKNGTVTGWQQEVDGADKPVTLKKEDIIHMYYKRDKGNLFGTSFLVPVIEDVKALRQAEENVLKMMFRHIYPMYHVAVGTDETPGSETEVTQAQDAMNNMDVDGGVVTSNRVTIKAIASDKVIDAAPYLKYLEERVFTGLGVPAVMFGRGDTSNRSTSDSMASEMSDRISAIQTIIEVFFNDRIIRELLLEGGYDPILNPDQLVEFRFKENDMDRKIKSETHAVYLYEHNSITEDEMRQDLGKDPIAERSKMFQTLITQANATVIAQATAAASPTSTTPTVKKTTKTDAGTKETNNKQKPTNQSGTKTSPKKLTNSAEGIDEICRDFRERLLTEDKQKVLDDFLLVDLKDLSMNLCKHRACNDMLHDMLNKKLNDEEILLSADLLIDRLCSLQENQERKESNRE